MLGFLTFSIAVLMTLSTDRLLLVFNPPRRREAGAMEDDAGVWSSRSVLNRSLGTAPIAALTIVYLGFAAASAAAIRERTVNRGVALSYKFDIPPLGAEQLPATIGEWRRTGFKSFVRDWDDVQAARSQTWTFTNGVQSAIVSLDYPYPSVHDLQPCYENLGWTTADRQTFDVPIARTPPTGQYVQMRLEKGGDQYGYVAYSSFTTDGQPEDLGRIRFLGSLSERFLEPLEARFGRNKARAIRAPVYQIQLVSYSLVALTPQQIRQLDDLLFECRQRLSAPKFKVPGQ
jgi:hypothetical protein